MKFIYVIYLFFIQVGCSQSFEISKKIKLSKEINETSGVIYFNKRILTFNDSGGKPELYVLSSSSGKIKNTIKITNATNEDWESISQDENFVYIGDTGNNRGSRKDLVIYKIDKKNLLNKKKVKAEKIYFSYEDQKSFEAANHANNFDCESITVYKNQLLIFTKNWLDFKTNIYTIPLVKGSYIAKKINSIPLDCLLTSVDYNPINNKLVGTAYDTNYKSYLIVINPFELKNVHFNKIALTSELGYANQIEGIAWKNNQQVFVTRESIEKELNGKKHEHKQKMFLITLTD
ncbi:hypothetical protein [Wenyingzhuangia sp. IMCC45467]